jgi:hypothetical protein
VGRAPHVEPGESSASDWQQGELTAALQIALISGAQTERQLSRSALANR